MNRQPRFEIVRTAAGWHARFRAGNGQVVWTTEVYTRQKPAYQAVRLFARSFWCAAAFVQTERRYQIAVDIHNGAPGIEVREVDQR